MDKALRDRAAVGGRRADWRRKMSDHVAFALLVYTGLQIFVTMNTLKTGHGSVMPYAALIVLVVAIIPGCRYMERRWEGLSEAEASDPSFGPAFRRDLVVLWLAAISLPLLLTYGYKLVVSFL